MCPDSARRFNVPVIRAQFLGRSPSTHCYLNGLGGPPPFGERRCHFTTAQPRTSNRVQRPGVVVGRLRVTHPSGDHPPSAAPAAGWLPVGSIPTVQVPLTPAFHSCLFIHFFFPLPLPCHPRGAPLKKNLWATRLVSSPVVCTKT